MADAPALTTSSPESPVTASTLALATVRILGLVVSLVLICGLALASLRFGSLEISTADAWNAIFNYDEDNYNQVIVRQLRMPRTVIALGVGGTLAVAGAVMQGVTRNPLAGPSILGVSSGASFGVTIAIYAFGLTSSNQYIWFAFAGALVASSLVFMVGAVGGSVTPVKLALAGVVISALLGAWTSAILLMSEETMDQLRLWTVGSVAGRDMATMLAVLPFLIPGVLVAILLGHQLNVLSMGDDNARALGMDTTRMRLVAAILVVVLTGAAVSVAGPVGFVGLATPHIARALVGSDYRWVLPYSFVLGTMLLVTADIVGRLATRPAELQVGIVMAVVGAPFLVYLARNRNVAN